MADNGSDAALERRANDLYWDSDLSVNQIAEELDLSKGMLYGMIAPLPAGFPCPDCGEAAVYPNRTARDRGLVSCPDCDWEGEDDPGADDYTPPRGMVRAPAPALARRMDLDDTRVMWGGALLGAAAGLALILWIRRR